jgi:hypothetical protein
MCGGTLRAIARISPARGDGAHCPSTIRHAALHEHNILYSIFVFSTENGNKREAGSQAGTQADPIIARSA